MEFTTENLETAANLVHAQMTPTAQYRWPLLEKRAGCELWVKHENHTPTGAFKVRGGITYIDWLKRAHSDVKGIITATRGNHGQSQARAAVGAGLTATIYVPEGNSIEKNAAMCGFGGDVIIHGADFEVAREAAILHGERENLHAVPPFHRELVLGVATYAYELFSQCGDFDTIYVPIGCGSGVCGTILARNALGMKADVVGVVSENAQTAKLSFKAGRLIETESADTFADGMAVRMPVKEAFDIYSQQAARIVAVSEDEVADAVRAYYTDTHNVAEGAGAAPLAAALQEREKNVGKKVAVILTGGNIDTDKFLKVLKGETPAP